MRAPRRAPSSSASVISCARPEGRPLRVRRRGPPLQPFVHPAYDVLEALDAVHRLARTRQLMRFTREPDHDGGDLPVFERPEPHFPPFAPPPPVLPVPQDE